MFHHDTIRVVGTAKIIGVCVICDVLLSVTELPENVIEAAHSVVVVVDRIAAGVLSTI